MCMHMSHVFRPLPALIAQRVTEMHAAQCGGVAEGNCAQSSVHAEDGSRLFMRCGSEAPKTKCPRVIDHALRANEINRAPIEFSVAAESRRRGQRSRVRWPRGRVRVQRGGGKKKKRPELRFGLRTEPCPLPLRGAASPHRRNQGQCCSSRTPATRSDKLST